MKVDLCRGHCYTGEGKQLSRENISGLIAPLIINTACIVAVIDIGILIVRASVSTQVRHEIPN